MKNDFRNYLGSNYTLQRRFEHCLRNTLLMSENVTIVPDEQILHPVSNIVISLAIIHVHHSFHCSSTLLLTSWLPARLSTLVPEGLTAENASQWIQFNIIFQSAVRIKKFI